VAIQFVSLVRVLVSILVAWILQQVVHPPTMQTKVKSNVLPFQHPALSTVSATALIISAQNSVMRFVTDLHATSPVKTCWYVVTSVLVFVENPAFKSAQIVIQKSSAKNCKAVPDLEQKRRA